MRIKKTIDEILDYCLESFAMKTRTKSIILHKIIRDLEPLQEEQNRSFMNSQIDH